MNIKFARKSLALVFLLFCASAFAQNDGSIPILQKGLTEALDQVFTMLQGVAIQWLGIFMILQFTWTHWQLIINDSDITKLFAKFASSLFWFGICIYIFNNGSDFIKNVSREIMSKATGATGSVFDPIQPISTGISVSLNMAGGALSRTVPLIRLACSFVSRSICRARSTMSMASSTIWLPFSVRGVDRANRRTSPSPISDSKAATRREMVA